jgi:cell division protease FtsH
MIEIAYVRTKELLTVRKHEVEVLAKELLEKEVLFQSDVEALIGKRPYEEKKLLDDVIIHHHEQNGMSAPPEKTVIDTSSEVK